MHLEYYSKEIQIEILNEIDQNQGTANTVDKTDPARDWNYDFLLSQGCIEQDETPNTKTLPNITAPSAALPLVVGKKMSKAGKLWRSSLYEQLENERVQTLRYQEQKIMNQNTAKTQNGIWRMTLAILGLTAVSVALLLFR